MTPDIAPVHPLAELEARQDEVLAQLEELERRTENALVEFTRLELPRAGGKPLLHELPASAA